MKAVLQRGKGPLSASAGGTLFHFGAPQTAASAFAACYSIDWDGAEPRVQRMDPAAGDAAPVSLTRGNSGLYSFSHEEFGQILLSKACWFETFKELPAGKGLLLSYQGFSEGMWYDGPFGRFEDGAFTDLVLKGGDFSLEIGGGSQRFEHWRQWATDEEFFAQKQSLIQAMRQRFCLFEETLLNCEGKGEAEEILNLLLFRLAFPHTKFFYAPRDPAWKRLAQNLGIIPMKEAKPQQVNQTAACSWGSASAVLNLLRWQMHQSPFIPSMLWARILN